MAQEKIMGNEMKWTKKRSPETLTKKMNRTSKGKRQKGGEMENRPVALTIKHKCINYRTYIEWCCSENDYKTGLFIITHSAGLILSEAATRRPTVWSDCSEHSCDRCNSSPAAVIQPALGLIFYTLGRYLHFVFLIGFVKAVAAAAVLAAK